MRTRRPSCDEAARRPALRRRPSRAAARRGPSRGAARARAFDLGMGMKVRRAACVWPSSSAASLSRFIAGIDFGGFALAAADVERPERRRYRCGGRSRRCGRQSVLFQLLAVFFGDAIGLFAGDAAELQQVVEITFAHALALLDRLVQLRLRERRLVAFVVTAAAVAVHVDDDVALELAAEVHRQPHALGDGLGVFAVDVEDRNLQHLGHVGGVGASCALPTGWS